MVTARNVVHAALYLVVALLSVGATFLLLGAEFAGWVQIYVGAIAILFLFGRCSRRRRSAGTPWTTHVDGWASSWAPASSLGSCSSIQDAFPLDAQAFEVFHATTGAGESIFRDFVLRSRRSRSSCWPPRSAIVLARKDEGTDAIRLPFVLMFAALLFSAGVYGVLGQAERGDGPDGIELMLNAVNVNLSPSPPPCRTSASIFALFAFAVAAAEVWSVSRDAILLFRNRASHQRGRGEPPQVVAAETTAATGAIQYAWVVALLPFTAAALTLVFGKRTPGKGSFGHRRPSPPGSRSRSPSSGIS